MTAAVDVPFADVSAMDGYAVAGEIRAETRLPVVGIIAAGDAPGVLLPTGTAMQIMTGAPVPKGADRVVPVEATDGGTEIVTIHEESSGRNHVRRRGEIVTRGAALLEPGSLLTPGALSVAATHGHDQLTVYRPARVAVLVTGNEVVPPATVPGPGQLRDSHTDFLLAAGRHLGLWVDPLGIAGDDPEALAEAIARGLEHDVLLVTGGVSMGEYDFVPAALERHGFRLLFDQVAVQPGKPLVAATRDHDDVGCRLAFGLPGNPASVMVTFWLFVRPLLDRLMGGDDAYWRGAVRATLAGPLPGAKGRDRFLPARLEARDGQLRAEPMLPKGSHDLAAYGHGTGLVRVPAGSPPLAAGEQCDVLPFM